MAWLRRSIFAALRGSRFALRCTLRPEDGFQVLRPTRSGVGGRSFSNPLHVAPPVFRSEATEWVPEDDVVPIPKYTPRVGEEDGRKRARLLYQSRKRGTLETGLLLSTFAAEHLQTLTAQQLDSYDLLINKPTNDWQLYYWIIGREEPPSEYCTDVLELLRQHTQNHRRRGSTALNPN